MRLDVVLVVLTSSITAFAAPSQDPRAAAGEAFVAAERAFSDEDYPEALAKFRTAFALVPDDAVRFNIAVCLERLGRFREAEHEYAAAAASTSLADEIRERARVEAERVHARLGKLVLTGRPPNASVQIDGVELCKLPCSLELDPGRREIFVEGPNGADRDVVVISRGATSRVTLDATRPPVRERHGAGMLTWVGAGAVVLGTGGAIYTGLRARSLHDDYLAVPTVETRDEGILMRNLTNVGIGIAVLGAAAVAIDLFVFARRTKPLPQRDHPIGMLAFTF